MSVDSKGRKVAYWLTTGLLVLGFLGGGAADLIGAPDVAAQFEALGYPAYLPRLLGVFKILGAIAIAAPKFPRLKEWAYAGMVFDLIGGAYSHAANGDGIDKLAPPLVFLAISFASYYLRPADRRLPDASA